VSAFTYPVNHLPSAAERWGAAHGRFEEFVALLKAHRGGIYHQHSWTRGLGQHHLRAARELGLTTLVTVHTPSNLCLRGSMVRFGSITCDGHIEAGRCGACWAHARGAIRPVAELLSRIPVDTPLRRGGRLATAFSARGLAAEKRRDFEEMVQNADRVIAVCQWLYDALLLNGVPREKLVLSRQGLPDGFTVSRHRDVQNHGPQRLLYLGRWHPSKGVHILIEAMRRTERELPIELTVYGIAAGAEEEAYREQVQRLAARDARIRFLPPLPRDHLAAAIAEYDVLLVPSLWLETGPLVVLEAMAAGLFIVGSRLGGIAELVREPEAGLLLPHADVAAWAEAIAKLAGRRRVRREPREVRTMDIVAQEMADLYASLDAAETCGSH
jgi:glycosyltransferase involved in cell wall biosynthesis